MSVKILWHFQQLSFYLMFFLHNLQAFRLKKSKPQPLILGILDGDQQKRLTMYQNIKKNNHSCGYYIQIKKKMI